MSAHKPSETIILLAEDEVTIRNLVNTMLIKVGYGVLVAANGVEALSLLEKSGAPAHLLLTNVRMPLMDGFTLVAKVRELRPEIKVVVMSAEMDQQILAGNKLDAFLRKPFVPPTLLRTIQSVLDGEQSGVVQA